MSDEFTKSPGGSYKGDGKKKKRKRVMKEFYLGEISAVDRPAQPHATMAIMKRDSGELMEKVLLLTSEVDGHQHMVEIDKWALERGGGHTDYTAGDSVPEGASHVDHHQHPFIIGADGSVTIGAASGHTHEIELGEVMQRLRLQTALEQEEDVEVIVEVNTYKSARDYALVPDLENSKTWEYPLTKRQNGRADRILVGKAVHALKRGKIPQEQIETVTRKVRKAWLQCNPSQKRSNMPAVLKRTFV